MTAHNPDNERTKRRYFAYLKEAKRHSEPTVDAVAKALARFEADTRHRDFRAFHFAQAIAFKKHLAEQRGQRSGEKLSKATLNATLAHVKRFFHWLAGQPGYKSRLQYSDADYFNLSEKDVRIATARREQTGPTLEQVKHVIALMPADTDIQRRDRALIAFPLRPFSPAPAWRRRSPAWIDHSRRKLLRNITSANGARFSRIGHEVGWHCTISLIRRYLLIPGRLA